MTIQDSISNHTVLAPQVTIESPELSHRWSTNFKQRIIEFYGFEGEDFRHFRALLESFFALNGITQENRKVIILKSQLRRAAAIFFSTDLKSKGLSLDSISYSEAIEVLQKRFLSKDLLEEYEYAFQSMKQHQNESPQMYHSRLYEAADLAEIQDDKMIFSRFRAGLLPQIIIFCKEQAATTHKDWVKTSNAWWNAHAIKPIHLVDNPFVSNGDFINGKDGIKFDSEKVKNDKMVTFKNNIIDKNLKPQSEAYASVISPSIANITAKLEALELHSLIPGNGYNGNIDNDISKSTTIKSLISDNEFKSFIKNIVQEVHNEKVSTYTPYKQNRKPYSNNNDNYYNDSNYNRNIQRNYRNNYSHNYGEGNNQYSQQENQRHNDQPYQNSSYNRNNYNNGRNNYQNFQDHQHNNPQNQNSSRNYSNGQTQQQNYHNNNTQHRNHQNKNTYQDGSNQQQKN